jgi:hypothetical protein
LRDSDFLETHQFLLQRLRPLLHYFLEESLEKHLADAAGREIRLRSLQKERPDGNFDVL